MNKEKVAKVLCGGINGDLENCKEERCSECAFRLARLDETVDQIIALIVDEDAELPAVPRWHSRWPVANIYKEAQQDMLAAGWRKVRGNDGYS